MKTLTAISLALILSSCMTPGEVRSMFEDYRAATMVDRKGDVEQEARAWQAVDARISNAERKSTTIEEVIIAVVTIYIPGAIALWFGRDWTRKRALSRALVEQKP